jgi:hypothetical protein
MQTDIWLNEEVAHFERCPLCNQSLKEGSTTCLSCGFSTSSPTGSSVWMDPAAYRLSSTQGQHLQTSQMIKGKTADNVPRTRNYPNPIASIPPRASTQSPLASPGSNMSSQKRLKNTTSNLNKPRRAECIDSQVRRTKTPVHFEALMKSTVLGNEASTVESSVTSPTSQISITEKPTQPEIKARGKETSRLTHIDEITTAPPSTDYHSEATFKSLVPVPSQFDVTAFHRPDRTIALPSKVEAVSWTAVQAAQSTHARLISSRGKRKKHQITISLNPIDRLRWWLLRPGHIEFILWLGGTLLLVVITCVLLFVTAFSFEWITPGLNKQVSSIPSESTLGQGSQSTVTSEPQMVLIRLDKGPILPGQSIELRGEGFSHDAHVRFLFDGTQQLFEQNGQFNSTQANAQGVFTVSVVLGSNLPWHPGPHIINAQDLITRMMATLHIDLSPAPLGQSVSNTPVSSYPPVQTPIPIAAGGQPTPVGQTPVPVTPTPQPVTPTPTVGTTPVVTPTAATSPTVGANSRVTTKADTTRGSGLGNALDNAGGYMYFGKQLTHLSPWVWLMIACYGLSMILLGLAGVLRRRQQ